MNADLLILLGTIPWILFLFVILKYNGKVNSPQITYKKFFLFVFLFTAIRYGVGYDYFTYKSVVEGTSQDFQLERWEFLSRYIALFCRNIHYQLFFIITSFLFLYPIYYVSKRLSMNPILTFSVFLLFPSLYLNSIGVVRNSVAYSFAFIAFFYLYRGCVKKSILVLMLSMGFHLSSFIAFLIYPIYYLINKRSYHILMYICSFFLSLKLVSILGTFFPDNFLYQKLISNIDKEIGGGGIFLYIFNLIALFNLLYWKRLSAISPLNKFYLSFINIGVCIWNSFLSIDPTTASRLSTFFILYIILLFPSYIKVIKVSKNILLLLCSLLYIASFFLNLYAYYVLKIPMANIPYQIFFLNPSDIFYH